MYEIKRFAHDGTVDADGHVLEPAWLWERYLEQRYVDRAIRIRTDAQGLEYLELNGRLADWPDEPPTEPAATLRRWERTRARRSGRCALVSAPPRR